MLYSVLIAIARWEPLKVLLPTSQLLAANIPSISAYIGAISGRPTCIKPRKYGYISQPQQSGGLICCIVTTCAAEHGSSIPKTTSELHAVGIKQVSAGM